MSSEISLPVNGSLKTAIGVEERREKRLNCKRCGSLDIWRVQSTSGLIARFRERGGKKRFACRACGLVIYALARRKEDEFPFLKTTQGPPTQS